MVTNKPNIYVAGASAKGLTFEQVFRNLDSTGQRPKVDSIQKLYAKEAWYRRCITLRARGVASIPYSIYKIGSDKPVYSSTEATPQEWQWLNLKDYLFRSEASLICAGASYSLMEYDKGKRGLKYYNPLTIEPVMTPQGIERFKRKINQRTYLIDAEHILDVYQPDPFIEQGPGSSDGEAGRIYSQVLVDLSGYSSEQLRSGLVKKTVFVAPAGSRPPDATEAKRLKDYLWNFMFGRYATPPEVMTGGIEPKEIGSSLADLSDDAITNQNREAISTGLGIPHSLTMSDAANHATAKQDAIHFVTNTTLPQFRLIANRMNEKLLNQLGYELLAEPEKMEVFQQSELEKAQSVQIAVGRPVLTVNEGRALLGYDPIDGGDAVAEPSPKVEINAKSLINKELAMWKTKAEKRGSTVKFICEHIPEFEESVIRERLLSGKSLDEAFSPPFKDF